MNTHPELSFVWPPEGPEPGASLGVRLAWGAETHQGAESVVNTDYYLVARFDRSMHMLASNLPRGTAPDYHGEAAYGAVLADGVGHARMAEVASRSAVSALIDLVLGTPDWILRLDDAFRERISKRMSGRLRWVDDYLAEQKTEIPAMREAGATITAMLVHGRDLLVAHVGRSRAYHSRAGYTRCVTTDHEKARVLGSAGGRVAVDVMPIGLEDGDRLMLCTDGLGEAVQESDVIEILGAATDPATTAKALVNQGVRNGARDDVTVIVMDYGLAT